MIWIKEEKKIVSLQSKLSYFIHLFFFDDFFLNKNISWYEKQVSIKKNNHDLIICIFSFDIIIQEVIVNITIKNYNHIWIIEQLDSF
jgi:hypothetical protein